MWWLLLISSSVFAQDDAELKAINDLGDSLPSAEYVERSGDNINRKETSRHRNPNKVTSMSSILSSGIEHGHVKAGHFLVRLSDNKLVETTKPFFGKFYRLQDERGFKYVVSNDGSCLYKMKSEYFNSVEPELVLYEPPLKYTPAPVNILRSDVDKKLNIRPEASFLVGMVQGQYMKDLFNDDKASSGMTTQYGVQVATEWKLPIKAGLVLHYEKTTYDLTGGGKINYSAFSFGPQFKTRDFDMFSTPFRFQTQFRVSPFARANAETVNGEVSFKFNSSDLMAGLEHPISNRLGEFVLGAFYQVQWLNLKDQSETVSVDSSNQTNASFGLSLSQVFK
jgi:hypothetical protein